MTQDDTGFLWQNLARYKRAKERGHKSAERFLDETYENFGFFGTLMHKTQSGLGKYEAQIIAWAKKSPARMIEENCHTNWDSMRAAWQNSFEEIYS